MRNIAALLCGLVFAAIILLLISFAQDRCTNVIQTWTGDRGEIIGSIMVPIGGTVKADDDFVKRMNDIGVSKPHLFSEWVVCGSATMQHPKQRRD